MGAVCPWRNTAERIVGGIGASSPHGALSRWLASVTLGRPAELERQDNARLLQSPMPGQNLKSHYRALLVGALEARILEPTCAIDLTGLDVVLGVSLTDISAHPERHVDEIADWLALEWLGGDPRRIARAYDLSRTVSPFGLSGPMLAPLQMLVNGTLPAGADRSCDAIFWAAHFLTRLDPVQTIMRELVDSDDTRRWRCWGAAGLMDGALVGEDGMPKASAVEPRSWEVRSMASTHGAFRYTVLLNGVGTLPVLSAATSRFFANPWGPIDLLLDPASHRKVCTGRGTHKRLTHERSTIVLALEPAHGLTLGAAALAAFIAWFKAGLSWIQDRYPWFVGTFEVTVL